MIIILTMNSNCYVHHHALLHSLDAEQEYAKVVLSRCFVAFFCGVWNLSFFSQIFRVTRAPR